MDVHGREEKLVKIKSNLKVGICLPLVGKLGEVVWYFFVFGII